jgi:hypothetical protein
MFVAIVSLPLVTLLAEFARHAIEPGLPAGVVNDPVLEHGFQEASVVEAHADTTSFVAVYADCPDFHKVYEIISALKAGETHDMFPGPSTPGSGASSSLLLPIHQTRQTYQRSL